MVDRDRDRALHVAITLAAAVVFGVDVLTPLGFGVWVFYLVPVALSLYTARPSTPLFAAASGTFLIVAGLFASPSPIALSPGTATMNRSMAVAALWIFATLARQVIITRLKLRERDWVRSGQRDLGARMQGELGVGELGDAILRHLCEYLDVPVGVLYAGEQDGNFRRVASYALCPDARRPDTVGPGEGLLGQAVKDRRALRFDDVPDDYLPVSSALGRARPRHVVVVPAVVDGAVHGVIELGFLRRAEAFHMELLHTIAEPVAIALRSSRYRTRLEELLRQTQRQAEQLQAQQEELRAANEELEGQAEALRESQARLEAQQTELEQTNAQLEEQAQALESQRNDLSRAQVELVDRAEELRRANQYKSEFLANMSHELRTPLNSMLILARLLADNKGGTLTPDQVQYASTISSSGSDLLALINDILDLSRIEAGRMDVEAGPVDLGRLVEMLERTFEPIANQKALAFETRLDTGASITTDRLRLQQILANLLSNAFKFTETGRVSLDIARVGGDRLSFAVRDTGPGIPAAQREVIFDAFRQADGSTQRRHGGSGLGLTIARQLARRLGGELSVDSAPPRGSTFTVVLPVHPGHGQAGPEAGREHDARRVARPAVAPARAAMGAGGEAEPTDAPLIEDDRAGVSPGDRTVLVVEDDPAFARIVRDLARERGFRCLVAPGAREALRLAATHAPSAIVLDIQLPDDSGLAVLEQLKRDGRTRHIPVHVVSITDYTQQALRMGAIGYAVKPVQREDLVRTFRRLEQRIEQQVRRVLIVEDVVAQRESLVALLDAAGVEIVAAGTAGQALARLKEHTFDCMVLDLGLPDMSGYELLETMAAGDAFSFPPVIVYTGRALGRDEEQRLARYARSIILKGARSPERLLDEVTLFLHRVESQLPPEQQRILRDVRNREAALEGRTILLVEDDVRNVFALSSVLEPRGVKVRIARNGREALAALDAALEDPAAGVDLVLMDIMMPEMDGLTATREIRARPAWAKLPIIALTAKAMPDDREQCLAAGADDYIAKPLDVDRLLSLVKVWMPR
jgi:CheY-like chemotaxis protein